MPQSERLPAVPKGALELSRASSLPAVFLADENSARRFWEFFTASIRNPNTRQAYFVAVSNFSRWCEERKLTLASIQPVHVASYIEELGGFRSKPTVKQHLAAVRMLFDWLVVGQIVPTNPAHSVRGPKHVVKKGKTPVLSAEEMGTLLKSIDTSTLVGLRDRALIGVMGHTFARVGAVSALKAEDYYIQGRRGWLRLHEKGGKVNQVPCHHNLEKFLDEWIASAGLAPSSPLFPSFHRNTGTLTGNTLKRENIHAMVKRRVKAAGIATKISCHSFRATGITTYLENGGKLEVAQAMAGHESARTTGLYDRRSDAIALDEVERVVY